MNGKVFAEAEMTIDTWLLLVGVCAVYIALGVWAIAQIFPSAEQKRAVTPVSAHQCSSQNNDKK